MQFLGELGQTIDWSPPPSWHPRSAAALYEDGITTIEITYRTRILNTEMVHKAHFKLASSISEYAELWGFIIIIIYQGGGIPVGWVGIPAGGGYARGVGIPEWGGDTKMPSLNSLDSVTKNMCQRFRTCTAPERHM